MQDDFLPLMRQLAPDLAAEMARRALVLERVAALAPVGRRQLAARLKLPEREIRAAASALKEGGLIRLDASGMTLTTKAMEVLPAARSFSRAMWGLTNLETRLAECLGIAHVHVAAGDCDEDAHVLEEVGRLAARHARGLLQSGNTLAVTGGSTMAQVARNMTSPAPMNVMVVPARGGMGRELETQANTLAAEIASRLGGHHRLIYLPDHLDAAAMQEMLKLPEVREAVELLERADVVMHGIGRADDRVHNQHLPQGLIRRLTVEGAVAEAFGYYFDAGGKCLYAASSLGVDLAKLRPSCQMIAVAAGGRKAQAILAVLRHYRHAMLVTDEGAARAMLRLLAPTEDCTPS